jgi:hypothetical protein
MKKLIILLKTSYSLGFLNIILVFLYRLLTRPLIAKFFFPLSKKIVGTIFLTTETKKNISEDKKVQLLGQADSILRGDLHYYSWNEIAIGETPNWFLNPFNKNEYSKKNKHWSELDDFNSKVGDIKNIWEASRFNWLGTLAYAYKITLNKTYLKKMNDWIQNWSVENPINTGPNWKCAQEASIRVINLLVANQIIEGEKASKSLIELLIIHIDRILPTTFYAKAQNNNHGLTEGCALYLAGHFLWKETKNKNFFSISKKGLNLLEDRVKKLILDDGTFSQYSIIYHRMILDLLSITKLFNDKWELNPFSKLFHKKVYLAIDWYITMIDPTTGNAPNMGANDGTYLFNYDMKEYRDFRPSLVLICSAFNRKVNELFISNHNILEIFNRTTDFKKGDFLKNILFNKGGYIKLIRKNGMALLKVPKYSFRPSHSDVLHLDIWQDGVNYIRDAGTYSYALDNQNLDFFSGTVGHSTVQFNNENQMPRLSRFLFGNWLAPSSMYLSENKKKMGASYRSSNNQYHSRSVKKIEKGWVIKDEIKGTFKIAVLRYILPIDAWSISLNNIYNKKIHINIISDHSIKVRMKEGLESLYYMKKEPVKVLEIETSSSCFIKTNLTFIN